MIKTQAALSCLVGSALVFLSCSPLNSRDRDISVCWGGSSSSNQVSEAKNLPAILKNLEPAWTLQLGTHQYTVPTIEGEQIFVGTNDANIDRPGIRSTGGGILLCVDRRTGKPLWQFHSPRFFEGMREPYHFNQWKCGFCSAPVVEGDRVFVVGGRGEILCLDRKGQADGNDGPFLEEIAYMGLADKPGTRLEPTDGDIVWCFNLIEELDVIPHDVCGSTLLLYDDLIFACTSNGVDGKHKYMPRPLAPSLIALEKTTGQLVAVEREKIGERTLHGQWSSPSFGKVDGNPLIFFGGGDGVLYAFRPPTTRSADSGIQALEKVWSYDCNPAEYRRQNGKPVAYARWNKKSSEGPSEIIGTPVFHANRVYVAIGQSPLHGVGQGQLCCVDAATGEEVWSSRLVDRTLATAACAEGLVFISDYTGRLHCFDASSGERYWVHDLEARTWSCSPWVADSKVYISSEDNTLWVLAAGKEKKVLGCNDFGSPPITAAAADGVLYVPTQRKLLAFPGATRSGL